MAYSATNFHSEQGVMFAERVKEYTDGAINITVHPGGSLVWRRRHQTRGSNRSGANRRTLYVGTRERGSTFGLG